MPYDQVFKTYNSKEDKRLRSSLLGETHVARPNRYIEGVNYEVEALTFIFLDDETSPNEIPKDKRVKYSGPKKENSNRLIEKFLEMIINDRYYAKNAPLWTA